MPTQAGVSQRYMTPREVAAHLLISERAVRNAISRGELRAVKVCRRVSIEAWVTGAQVEPIARAPLPSAASAGVGGLRGVLSELRS